MHERSLVAYKEILRSPNVNDYAPLQRNPYYHPQVAARKPTYLGAQRELVEQTNIPRYRIDPLLKLEPVPGSSDQMPQNETEKKSLFLKNVHIWKLED